MAREYVEQRNDGYYVAASRVSLDSVVFAFLRGESPEGIVESFPVLNLEQVYGAITHYLANRAEIDAYLDKGKAEFALLRMQARQKNPRLYTKLDAARRVAQTPRA